MTPPSTTPLLASAHNTMLTALADSGSKAEPLPASDATSFADVLRDAADSETPAAEAAPEKPPQEPKDTAPAPEDAKADPPAEKPAPSAPQANDEPRDTDAPKRPDPEPATDPLPRQPDCPMTIEALNELLLRKRQAQPAPPAAARATTPERPQTAESPSDAAPASAGAPQRAGQDQDTAPERSVNPRSNAAAEAARPGGGYPATQPNEDSQPSGPAPFSSAIERSGEARSAAAETLPSGGPTAPSAPANVPSEASEVAKATPAATAREVAGAARASPAPGIGTVPGAQQGRPGAPVLRSVPAAKPGMAPAQTPREAFRVQVARDLAAAVQRGQGTLTLRLKPESLGQLHVRVSLKEGVLSARFEAQTAQARDLLVSTVGELRRSLEAAGVRVERLEASVSPQLRSDGGAESSLAPHDEGQGSDTHGGAHTPDGRSSGPSRGEHDTDVAPGTPEEDVAAEPPAQSHEWIALGVDMVA